MLVKNGSFTRSVFHLGLDGAALVSIDVRIGALLLHPLVVESFGVLDHILRIVLIMLKLLSQWRLHLKLILLLSTHRKRLSWYLSESCSQFGLFRDVSIVIKDRITLARLYESSNACFRQVLVVEGLVEVGLPARMILDLQEILGCSEFALILLCG